MIIHGHDVPVEDIEDADGIVTDVLVLTRVVSFNEDGQAQDHLVITGSRTTTGMVIDGMVREAQRQSDLAAEEASWSLDDEDDD